tara:strand:- start:983 stop:2104 length:1122 start_codon:yes stop_codon:yes gene_type:complete
MFNLLTSLTKDKTMYQTEVQFRYERWSIQKILKLKAEDKLQRDPDYQRNDKIWTTEKRNEFCQGLFNYPMSSPILLDGRVKTHYKIINGQQRLHTLNELYQDNLELKPLLHKNYKYQLSGLFIELPKLTQNFLLKEKLNIVIAETGSDQDMIELYQNENQGTPLNSAEMRKPLNRDLNAFIYTLFNTHDVFKFMDLRNENPKKAPIINATQHRESLRTLIEQCLLIFNQNAIGINISKDQLTKQALTINTQILNQEFVTDMLDAFTYVTKGIDKIKRTNPDLIIKARGRSGKTQGIFSKALFKQSIYCYYALLQKEHSMRGKEVQFVEHMLQYKTHPKLKEKFAPYATYDSATHQLKGHQLILKRVLKENWVA